MANALAERDRVVAALEGRECRYCQDGTLTRGQHSGSPAVVCTDCGVPQVCFS